MGGNNRHPGIDPEIAELITLKARRMRQQRVFRDEELGDLQQMLRLQWLQAEGEYDTSRGERIQFADTVFDNCICKLLEFRNADKRAWWLCQESLDDPVDVSGERGLTGHDVYDGDDYFQRMGANSWSEERLNDFQRRLEAAQERLTPRQREFALRLMSENPTDIAAEMGVHRSTLYEWRKRIQREFRKVGLDAFLKSLR